jgi:hypothetical protein
LLELKFVWALLQAEKKWKNKVFTFNKKQTQALDHLSKALEGHDNDDQNAINALYLLFDEVYSPEAYETKNTDFDMPDEVRE